MKLWSAIFVICLLASTVQGVFAVNESGIDTGSGIISEAPMNPEFIEYQNTVQQLESLKKILSNDRLGYIPEPADTTHLKGKKISKKALEAEAQGISDVSTGDAGEIVSAPATYDLRTAGKVSPVKNQGSCGSCWAFATYGSMESEALPGQLFDFSENNLKNTNGFDGGPCAGGNSQMATAYLARWSGAVAEAADPYVDSSTSNSPTGLPVQEHAQEMLQIPGRSGPLDNDNIKATLQTTGALYTTMYWSNTYYNPSTSAYYYSGTAGSTHAVTIVGWDDAYSRTNFLTAPPGDGAFIIKNSWGTSWGNNGYFYMSYYDSKVGKSLTVFTGESATNYAHIYQYDPLGWISSMGYNTDTAWAANVFTATSQEAVSAVGLSTNQVNTAYQVFIYTNPTQGPISSAGPVSTVQGTIGIPGYHTVTLPTPVAVKAGDKFSVVVRFQTPNYVFPITIEKIISGYSSQATASAGQSYTSSTGTSWTDLTASIPNANVCLKAYTVNTGTSAPVAAFSVTPVSGTAPLTVKFTDQSTGTAPLTWAWDFNNDGVTDTNLQNPTIVYSVVGTYTAKLTVSNSAGTSAATKTITVTTASVPPTAIFSTNTTSGTAPLAVKFTDQSTGTAPLTWAWDFNNDGVTDTNLQNPTIVYSVVGTYTAKLTVSNSAGTSAATKTITVNTAPVAPVAAFTGSPTIGTAPLKVIFTDSSTGSITTRTWQYKLTSSSTWSSLTLDATNAFTFTTAGTYDVRLTVTGSGGSNTQTITGYITVTSVAAPVASFTGKPTSGVSPLTVIFTGVSTNSPTSWEWTFGDGGTSSLQSPSHTYTTVGTYTVTLTVKNAQGTSQVTKRNYIKVRK